MKKFIVTAIAAGALAAGGAASAQDLGSVISGILGLTSPSYSNNYGYSYPGMVAPQAQVYTDTYGRRFYYDQYGQQVYLNNSGQVIVGYDQWGRPIYGTNYSYGSSYPYYGSNYAWGNGWDRDGDGISNSRDRWPDDPRYR
ncbi:MAG: hypothetical protein HY854_07085 [Burkholderiales bacterium]|nr:hypothetical protein [Burkholderiales bacterium]